jgi:hypothetical protein
MPENQFRIAGRWSMSFLLDVGESQINGSLDTTIVKRK